MNDVNDRLLVTGTGGQLGRGVVEELLRLGAQRVVATTRNPDKLNDLRNRGVEVRAADFDRPETLAGAFAGVDRAAIISTDALDVPGKRLAQHRAAVNAAAVAGVRHVVYTSAPAPYPTADSSLNNDHFWTEAALFAAPFTWTVLRNQLYMEVVLMGAGSAIKGGKLFSATGGRGRAYVSRGDCARTVAGALVRAERSEVLDVTGPAAVTQDELAATLARLSGRPVVHVEVSPTGLAEGLSHAHLPPALVSALVDFDVAASQGYHAIVTPTVERLTGSAPVTLDAFLGRQSFPA